MTQATPTQQPRCGLQKIPQGQGELIMHHDARLQQLEFFGSFDHLLSFLSLHYTPKEEERYADSKITEKSIWAKNYGSSGELIPQN